MAKKIKTQLEKQLMLKQEREKVICDMLLYSKKRFKKFDEVIIELYKNEDLSRFFIADKRMWKINECFNSVSERSNAKAKTFLKDVFLYLNKCSLLTSNEFLIFAVYNAFQFRHNWLNDIFKWKPVSKHASFQFKELADYLFCLYKMPAFLYKAFYENNLVYTTWFIHLGSGGKVREMQNIPIPFTQKMSHHFTQAPEKLSVAEALRWAQVKGLGGDDGLAERIAFSWIGAKPFGDENFWETFLQLIIRNQMFNQDKLTELTDFVREARRINPVYNLKGRTLQSLLRQSDKWHNVFAHVKGNLFWKPCGIDGFRIERKDEIIKLEELNEAKKLIEEGTAMKHCVASYTHYCAQGKTAIYSLRKYSGGTIKDILATIEINIFLRRIVQAKARMNKPVSEEAKKYMTQWAVKNALTISECL